MGIGGLAIKLFKNTFIKAGSLPKAGAAAEKAVEKSAKGAPQAAPWKNVSSKAANIKQSEVPKPAITKVGRILNNVNEIEAGQKIQLGKMMASFTDTVLERLKSPECSKEVKDLAVKLLNRYRVNGNKIETTITQGTATLGRLRVEGKIAYMRIGNFGMQGEVNGNNIVFELLNIL